MQLIMAQNETYLNSACTKNPNNLPLFIQDLKKHDHYLQHPYPSKRTLRPHRP